MSMESDPLRQQLASMRQALFDEGLLNSQFATLEFLETKDEPNFVEEVIGLFFRDSTKLFETIEKALEKTPFDPIMMDKYLHQFKGSSSSVGANQVLMECNQMREYVNQGDVEMSKATFQLLKKDHGILRSRLESYFQVMRQVGPAETAERPE